MKIERITLPSIPDSDFSPELTKEEVDERYIKLIEKMKEKNLSHVLVYGDREHFPNLAYLTGGYDPRFEESLLIVPLQGTPVLVVGNEGYSYSDICLLRHKKELFQTFSLQGQIRDRKRRLKEIFRQADMDKGSKVGVVGIKYYEEDEVAEPLRTFDIPHYIIEELCETIPVGQIENCTKIMTHPQYGLRCAVTHHEIARFECLGNYLTNQMKKVIDGLRIGMTETQALANFRYIGIPFTVHPVVNFGARRVMLGLASPIRNKKLEKGDAVSVALGVEGANSARTGFAVSSEKELTGAREGIIDRFYYPYYRALKIWYESLRIGAKTRAIFEEVRKILGEKRFGVSLNPGHQIHMEEWINSPFREDVDFTVHSGLALQADIIAFPDEPYVGVHVEDTLAIADPSLQERLKRAYPDTWSRIQIRKKMMKDILGVDVAMEVLPMSNLQAVLFPFLLDTRYVVTAAA